jgi:hypothetical protein
MEWLHHNQLQSKAESMLRKHTNLPTRSLVLKSAHKAKGILLSYCRMPFFRLLHEETPAIHHKRSVYFCRMYYYCHGILKNVEESSLLFFQYLNHKMLRNSGFFKQQV